MKLAVATPVDPDSDMQQIAEQVVPAGTPYSVVGSVDLFNPMFDAYEYLNGEAVFNPDKGCNIQKARWREARKPLLDALDVAYMRALEVNDAEKTAQIAAQKQALRDVTLTPIEATTPEGVWNTWPEILNPTQTV